MTATVASVAAWRLCLLRRCCRAPRDFQLLPLVDACPTPQYAHSISALVPITATRPAPPPFGHSKVPRHLGSITTYLRGFYRGAVVDFTTRKREGDCDYLSRRLNHVAARFNPRS